MDRIIQFAWTAIVQAWPSLAIQQSRVPETEFLEIAASYATIVYTANHITNASITHFLFCSSFGAMSNSICKGRIIKSCLVGSLRICTCTWECTFTRPSPGRGVPHRRTDWSRQLEEATGYWVSVSGSVGRMMELCIGINRAGKDLPELMPLTAEQLQDVRKNWKLVTRGKKHNLVL